MPIVSGGGGGTFNGGTITPAAGATGLGITPVNPNGTAADTVALKITVPQSGAPNFPNIYALRVVDPDTGTTVLQMISDGSFSIAGQPFSVPLQVHAAAANPDTRTVAVFDTTGDEALRVDKDGGTSIFQAVGFYGTAPGAKPTVTGAKLPSDVALASLLTALAGLGLITNSTT